MYLIKQAMIFPILLTAPISLFTNALPADGPTSSQTPPFSVGVLSYGLILCSSSDPLPAVPVIITQDNVCYPIPKPTSELEVAGFLSGQTVGSEPPPSNFLCKAYWYAGLNCNGGSIGVSSEITNSLTPGPCVEFTPKPLNIKREYSVKITCSVR